MKATREFVLRADHPVLAGHFPGHPVVPGVILLSWCELLTEQLAGAPVMVHNWINIKFLRPLGPAQTCRIILTSDTPGKAAFIIEHSEQLIARGRLEWSLEGS